MSHSSKAIVNLELTLGSILLEQMMAYLYVVKYSQGKYKLQKKNGWSNRYYIRFSNGKLVQTSPEMGSVEFKRIERSEIPNYIKK